MDYMPDDSPHAVGRRVTRLWRALEYPTSAAFAHHLGVSPSRLNNVERGTPLSIDLAKTICRRVPGMSLDWLYHGNPAALPLQLAKTLDEDGSGNTKTQG
jgi:DNA-binding XRE family transcriptional regulator